MGVETPPVLSAIASKFCSSLQVLSVRELGQGNINNTYLVTTTDRRFVLQRINPDVFHDPEQVVLNGYKLTAHFISGTKYHPERWKHLSFLLAKEKKPFFCDENNHIWRCMNFVENSYSCGCISSPDQGYQIGRALACFHLMSSDLESSSLAITIPGFHHLPTYLNHYDRVLLEKKTPNSVDSRYCLKAISDHRIEANRLEAFEKSGRLKTDVIHGDPKIANFLFDTRDNHAICLIDLDTVGPGFIQSDLGDCLRSSCNSIGEEGKSDLPHFDTDICRAVLTGYFDKAPTLINQDQKRLIFNFIKLITFELGLRFFTDYLAGNIYFKVENSDDNLTRAVMQFRLMESITRQKRAIHLLLNDLGNIK